MSLHTSSVIFNAANRNEAVPTQGTFAVQIPAVAATTFAFQTIVILANMLPNDVVSVTNITPAASTYGVETTAKILFAVAPQNGQLLMRFINIGAATGYTEHVFAYTTSR